MGLRRFFQRRKEDAELARELEAHIAHQVDENISAGMSEEEARRQAYLKMGSPRRVREDLWTWNSLGFPENLVQDFRYASRRLRRTPGFAAVSVLTLALGIGASTAIFSAVNPILFEPLPYPQAGRIMMIWDIFNDARGDVTFHTYRELAERNHAFEAISVITPWQPTMTGPAQPERFDGQKVSASYFSVLGVQPAMGRDFQASDDQFKGPRVAIISYGLWQRRFGGDGNIVARQFTLEGNLYTIIGVMPKEFENVLAPSAEIWSPLQYDSGNISDRNSREWGHHLRMVGRLRVGIGTDQARGELSLIARTPITEFPRPRWASLGNGFIVNSLQHEVTRGIKPALLAILGAVLLVLSIACVNVTHLLLARGVQRRGEFAMRSALGAGRGRLVRQLLTESLLLAAMSCVAGMVVAMLGVRALVALAPPGLPRAGAIGVDVTAFMFALCITMVVGIVVGLVPALHASRRDLRAGVQQSSSRASGGHQRARRTLVVAEVALALVLLVSTGLLLRSFDRLFSVAPGFDASHVITMQVQTAGRRFDDESNTSRFFDQALEKVQKVPGVDMAGFTSLLPLSGDLFGGYGLQFEDGSAYNVFRYVVTPGYLETMGIHLRRGRTLDARDAAGAPPAVLISESVAKSKFPGQNPIGQRVHVGPVNRPWYIIVGVVGDVKQSSLAVSDPDAVYITTGQSWFADDALSLVVRTRGEAAALVPAIQGAIWSVDKDQPIVRVATMDSLLVTSEAERHFALILFEAFALAALLLAAIGIYGVLSGSVTERMREIGVRSALGASQKSILALILRQGMALTGIGVVIGLAASVVASRGLVTLLFGVSRLDPLTYLGVVALLLGVAVLACWVPARRAARVDPSITLRAE